MLRPSPCKFYCGVRGWGYFESIVYEVCSYFYLHFQEVERKRRKKREEDDPFDEDYEEREEEF